MICLVDNASMPMQVIWTEFARMMAGLSQQAGSPPVLPVAARRTPVGTCLPPQDWNNDVQCVLSPVVYQPLSGAARDYPKRLPK